MVRVPIYCILDLLEAKFMCAKLCHCIFTPMQSAATRGKKYM